MEKIVPQASLFLLVLLCISMLMPGAVLSKSKKPKKLDFYMLIVPQNDSFLDNPNAHYTAVRTAAALRPQLPFAFGTIHTFDNPISKTMSLASASDVLGRVQGWYGNCGQGELTLCLVQTFTYDDGHFKGTFSLLGADIATAPLKHAPIVGGTGNFSFGHGIAAFKRVSNTNINNEETNWFSYSVKFKF